MKNGYIAAELNTRSFPEIDLHPQYRTLLSSGSCQDTASYLSAKYQEWRWLSRALRQRKQTITRIVNELITRQKDFFLKGRSAMKPLTLREVADCLSLHESTVSRAIKGKTIQTPYGLFEMKLFFSAKAEASGDGDASNYAVKTHLENLSIKRTKQNRSQTKSLPTCCTNGTASKSPDARSQNTAIK